MMNNANNEQTATTTATSPRGNGLRVQATPPPSMMMTASAAAAAQRPHSPPVKKMPRMAEILTKAFVYIIIIYKSLLVAEDVGELSDGDGNDDEEPSIIPFFRFSQFRRFSQFGLFRGFKDLADNMNILFCSVNLITASPVLPMRQSMPAAAPASAAAPAPPAEGGWGNLFATSDDAAKTAKTVAKFGGAASDDGTVTKKNVPKAPGSIGAGGFTFGSATTTAASSSSGSNNTGDSTKSPAPAASSGGFSCGISSGGTPSSSSTPKPPTTTGFFFGATSATSTSKETANCLDKTTVEEGKEKVSSSSSLSKSEEPATTKRSNSAFSCGAAVDAAAVPAFRFKRKSLGDIVSFVEEHFVNKKGELRQVNYGNVMKENRNKKSVEVNKLLSLYRLVETRAKEDGVAIVETSSKYDALYGFADEKYTVTKLCVHATHFSEPLRVCHNVNSEKPLSRTAGNKEDDKVLCPLGRKDCLACCHDFCKTCKCRACMTHQKKIEAK